MLRLSCSHERGKDNIMGSINRIIKILTDSSEDMSG